MCVSVCVRACVLDRMGWRKGGKRKTNGGLKGWMSDERGMDLREDE